MRSALFAILSILVLLAACQPVKQPAAPSCGGSTPAEGGAVPEETEDIDEGLADVEDAVEDVDEQAPTNETKAETPAANETKADKSEAPVNATTTPDETKTETKLAEPKNETAANASRKKTFTEGDIVQFPSLKAVDADGDTITYYFSAPLNASGQWQTKRGDAGNYPVTITASDGKTNASVLVLVEVLSANKAPEISSFEDIVAKEGTTITLAPKVTDPDNDPVNYTVSGWMTSLEYKTNYDDQGKHVVTVTASDGHSTTNKSINVVVTDVNRPPEIASLRDFAIKEGDTITVMPFAKDPDGDSLDYSFSSPMLANGTWKTKRGDAGSYRVNATASDGRNGSVKGAFFIVVQSVNVPPEIKGVFSFAVNEGELASLNVNVTDPDGDNVTVTYSGWMTGRTYQTTYNDAGVHNVTVTANDGQATSQQVIVITVNDVNRPPEFVFP